ncbi:MAG: phospho-sugar mutase, partial [Clostridiales Family XIII bacterium]|nr:phospho-sugar mutase [Clostridiales Family XIII bacterium]
RKISQGFAERINEEKAETGGGTPSVAIAYDNRRDSDLFAFEAACVFAANGIRVELFDTLSATPLLSFAVRELHTDAGVVVTASHNNKAYNGYKIYDRHGCQCMPGDARKVADKIDRVDMWTGVKTVAGKYTKGRTAAERTALAAEEEPLISLIGEAVTRQYTDHVRAESKTAGACRDIRVVYTPLNGTGNLLVRRILTDAEIGDLIIVPEQENPDPDFTTCPEPNPEKPGALNLGLALCEKRKAAGAAPDLLLGTDPDADRLGAAVFHDGGYVRLSGNQVGILLLDYVVACRERDGTMPDRPVFVTTIVSTPLTGEMAKRRGIETRKVLTGFKNIGDQMNALEAVGEESRYIFGFEESCGYNSGVYARDKDAQDAALLLCEAAGVQKSRGKTLLDRMDELYAEYGFYIDGLDEFVRPGEKGMREIAAIMGQLREPKTMDAFSAVVVATTDFESGVHTSYKLGGRVEKSPVAGIPSSNVIEFDLADGCKVLARPSGTEPKLKIYYTGVGKTEADARKAIERMRAEVAKIAVKAEQGGKDGEV